MREGHGRTIYSCREVKENEQTQRGGGVGGGLRSSRLSPLRRLLMTVTTTQHMSPITRRKMINLTSLTSFSSFVWCQFQKQGKDAEKVKQRLAEIANYVDKVTIKSAACKTTRRAGGRSVGGLRAGRCG